MPERIRIFIGTEPKTEIARLVLQRSIIAKTEADVEFIPMIGHEWSYSTNGFKAGTGFSLRRWMIPAYCKWRGRAIYLDADMLVFSDIREIWEQPDRARNPEICWTTYQADKYSPHKPVPQTSVMVIDCAMAKDQMQFQLPWALEYLKACSQEGYQKLMHGGFLTRKPGVLPTEWNHLMQYEPGRTKLLHYTSVPNQPWYKPDHHLAYPWKAALQNAIAVGMITPETIGCAVEAFGKDGRGEPTGLHPEYQGYALSGSRRKYNGRR